MFQASSYDSARVTWSGYYMQDGQRQDMRLDGMTISEQGDVYCQGSDTIGPFQIRGKIFPNAAFNFTKAYPTHQVAYNGTINKGAL